MGYLILATYFKKHRGLANAWLMAGAGLGHFFSPLLIRLLQNNYGHRGATMIIGAIILHGFLGATVFHPVEWHNSRKKKFARTVDVEVTSSLLLRRDTEERNGAIEDKGLKDVTQKINTYTIRTNTTSDSDSGQMRYCVTRSSSANHNTAETREEEENAYSYEGLCSSPRQTTQRSNNIHQNRVVTSGTLGNVCQEKNVCCFWQRMFDTVKRVGCSVLKDMAILRRPSCLIIALGSTFVTNGEANFTVMIPFAIQVQTSYCTVVHLPFYVYVCA